MSGETRTSLPADRPTITDVAREAGVSVSTVSKVVNGRYGIASTTSKRVLDVVEALGYETSMVASSLRRRRSNVIGILVSEFESFSVELLKGASSVAGGAGYELLAYAGPVPRGGPGGWERRSLSRLAGTLIDGAILVTPTVLLPSTSIPVVAIDPHVGQGGPATIDSDNLGGARSATRHLIALGHRSIAHLRGRSYLASAQLRERGFREALAEAGVPLEPGLVVDGSYLAEPSTVAARALLQRPDRPTAVFAAKHTSALVVQRVAAELGLRVPQDLSVVGFDDLPEAQSSTPPRTTVAQPLQDIGARAIDTLVALLAGSEVPDRVHLPARLVVRGTTGPPPGR